MPHACLGSGNSNMWYVHPENWGRWFPFWRAYFSDGWGKETNYRLWCTPHVFFFVRIFSIAGGWQWYGSWFPVGFDHLWPWLNDILWPKMSKNEAMGTQTCDMFTPKIGEDDSHFDEHIFQMGGEKKPTIDYDALPMFFFCENFLHSRWMAMVWQLVSGRLWPSLTLIKRHFVAQNVKERGHWHWHMTFISTPTKTDPGAKLQSIKMVSTWGLWWSQAAADRRQVAIAINFSTLLPTMGGFSWKPGISPQGDLRWHAATSKMTTWVFKAPTMFSLWGGGTTFPRGWRWRWGSGVPPGLPGELTKRGWMLSGADR